MTNPCFALFQDGSTSAGEVPFSGTFLFWVLIVFVVAVLVAGAFWIGRFWGRFKAGRNFAADREKMFNIEKALQEFFESDRQRLETEKSSLAQKAELLEKKNDEYKRKAAGVGMMGMGKDRKADLLLELMAENEALEEKLFEQNLKLKNERDEHLARELQHVSVKRVLLSEVLKDSSVRESIRNVLADEGKLKRVSLDRPPEPAEQIVEGTARVVEDPPTTDAETQPAQDKAPSA